MQCSAPNGNGGVCNTVMIRVQHITTPSGRQVVSGICPICDVDHCNACQKPLEYGNRRCPHCRAIN